MLDQSFSAENFKRILDYENRKGVYIEGKYFSNIERLTQEIKNCNIEIRDRRKTTSPEDFEKLKKEINEKKEKIKEKKEEKLREELQKVSDIIINDKFRISLTKDDTIANKPVYKTEDKPECFFAIKQIQYNFRKLYKVKQASRFAIVSQVKELLSDDFPKLVIRTDIQDFYESVPHDKLLQKINEENLLSFYSKKILFQVLNEYKRLSGNQVGVPRGVGVSAYLAELYMRDIDNHIKAIPAVTYYARYVDDIIIIFTPGSSTDERNYLRLIDKVIEEKFSLTRNTAKTQTYDSIDTPSNASFDYLGYSFQIGNGPTKLSLTAKKIARYKERMNLALKSYTDLAVVNEKKARKILIQRMRFLTGNTRLLNNKRNILVGVYFSNSLLTDSSAFHGVDAYWTYKINSHPLPVVLKERLKKYVFSKGFEEKRFSMFTTTELSEILTIWKR